MKFRFDKKKKIVEGEVGLENIVEKAMDLNDKNWKDKQSFKHNAKKEILELKHQHHLDIIEKENEKKVFLIKF